MFMEDFRNFDYLSSSDMPALLSLKCQLESTNTEINFLLQDEVSFEGGKGGTRRTITLTLTWYTTDI